MQQRDWTAVEQPLAHCLDDCYIFDVMVSLSEEAIAAVEQQTGLRVPDYKVV
jgi:hypothetical protein